MNPLLRKSSWLSVPSFVMHRYIERIIRVSRRLLDNYAGIREPEDKIIADSQAFWNNLSNQGRDGGPAHFRGQSIFADDNRWVGLGENSLRIFYRLAGQDWLTKKPRRILDWGCGGGSCAVHFAPAAASYYGVDITEASLAECKRQVEALGLHNFEPVLFQAPEPERVARLIDKPCDLVLSTYVFELLPSKEYGRRVLRTIHELLADEGLAFIQIKYSTHKLNSMSYRWGYSKNLGNMTTYFIEEFWTMARECGFEPQLLYLEPVQPLNNDHHFAYFLMEKAKGS
ncbi:class I SAM-dependent methyltransferase [Hymenobacter armeniacus]|uniref:Class I SAM-dependent methyltransferase n=1 Tax=Hymenobacter armeniacus TaxID=2771358 RepID=A0ABR8JQB2_9BACT|nr:class I SAM-dependent methyltransferase [Hymenobacter armeniacus]MBD2722166.1 class I SAM-dependent methyltransferase [Hymenobacter armeniacus]